MNECFCILLDNYLAISLLYDAYGNLNSACYRILFIPMNRRFFDPEVS